MLPPIKIFNPPASFIAVLTWSICLNNGYGSTVIATQDFDSVTVPAPASSFFTFGASTSADFINSVQITAGNDIDGTGLGVGYSYDPFSFTGQSINVHVFESLGIGTYEIQYKVRGDVAGDAFDSSISDGSNTVTKIGEPINTANTFEEFTTGQITLSSPGNLTLTLTHDPLVSSFITNNYAVDDIELILIPEPSSALLAGLGLLALTARRRRKG